MYHYDLNFLDDVSDRRPSVLCPPVQRTFVSAREKVQMGATKSAEKAVFEWVKHYFMKKYLYQGMR